MDATISLAECKSRLEAEGFIVIPKERVLKLCSQRQIYDHQLLAMDDAVQWKDYATASMGRDLGMIMVRDRAVACDEFKTNEEETYGRYCPSTVLRLTARVIIPKGAKCLTL